MKKIIAAIVRFFQHPVVYLRLFNAEGCREPRRTNICRNILKGVINGGHLELAVLIAKKYLGRGLERPEFEMILIKSVEKGNIENFFLCNANLHREARVSDLEVIVAVKVKEGNRQGAEAVAKYLGRGLRPEEKQDIVKNCVDNGRDIAAAYSSDSLWFGVNSGRYWS